MKNITPVAKSKEEGVLNAYQCISCPTFDESRVMTLPSSMLLSDEASEGDTGEVGEVADVSVSRRTESSVVLSKDVEQDLSGPSDIASASCSEREIKW